jgi:hypothetical protein
MYWKRRIGVTPRNAEKIRASEMSSVPTTSVP